MGDQREFSLPNAGIRCGNCGTVLPRVYRTITSPGFVTRERVCPHCQQINTTSERVINTRDRRTFNSPCEE